MTLLDVLDPFFGYDNFIGYEMIADTFVFFLVKAGYYFHIHILCFPDVKTIISFYCLFVKHFKGT